MSNRENQEFREPILPRSISAEESPTPTQSYPQTNPTPASRARSRSVFWPMILISAGVLMLLSNLGIFPASGWAVLWRFWPLALIALGVDVLFGHRSIGGAVLGGLLILMLIGGMIGLAFFAEQIPMLVELTKPAELHFEHLEHPLDDFETAHVEIDLTSAPGYVGVLDDSNNLIEADIAYRGELIFQVDDEGERADIKLDSYLQGISYGDLNFDDNNAEWDVRLSPDVILDLYLDAHSGYNTFNLNDLQIKHLNLDAGSGGIALTLPENMSFDGKIDGGSGAINISLPEDSGMRVVLEEGSGQFRADERFVLVDGSWDDDGTWETENYDEAEYQIVLEVDQGSGGINIQE